MSATRKRERDVVEEKSKRQLRADRILAAAAELTERWGYQKTTIDDIARQAGVAKGTIYLHWKTREDLFMAMLLREQLRMARVLKDKILGDPEGVLLHGMFKHALIVLEDYPLIKAVFLLDSNLLGDLLTTNLVTANLAQQKLIFFENYFRYLREKGLLRIDKDIQSQIYQFSAITIGYMLIDQFFPKAYHRPAVEVAEMASQTIKQLLEPEEPISPELMEVVRKDFHEKLEFYLTAMVQQIEKAIEI